MKAYLAAATLVALAVSCQPASQRVDDATPKPGEHGRMNAFDPTTTLEATHSAFRAADGSGFSERYAVDALMVLSNGTVLRGHEALSAAAAKSGPSVRNWEVRSPRVHRVDHGMYLAGASHTELELPDGKVLSIDGQRLVYWSVAESKPLIQADISLAGPPAAVPDAIRARVEQLADAWNAHDEQAALSVFRDDSVYVLSDGRSFMGSEIGNLLRFAFEGEIRDMLVEPRAAWVAGEDTAYVAADYSFQFKPAGEFVASEGCRFDVWKKTDEEWRLLVQVAQPKGSAACVRGPDAISSR